MRKLTCATAAFAVLLATASPALALDAGIKQKLKASISPTKIGSKPKKPVNVTFNVNPYFDVADAATLAAIDANPFATKIAHVYLDKAFIFNTKAFPMCSTKIVAADETTCPKGSKVGSGSAVGRALKINQTDLKVTAYNSQNKHFLLHVVGKVPLPIDSIIDGVLKTSTGQYGYELKFTIPRNLQEVADNVFAALTDFKTSIPAKPTGKGKVAYVQAKSCPKGGLKVGYKGEYTDGTSQTVAIKVPCK